MIILKNVTKTFGDTKALDNVSFEVEKGEFIFLTGPSGAGKTTIVRLILGEITPDQGKIIFQGHDIAKLKRKEIPDHRQKIGVVFQDFKVLPERTVSENVEVALAVIGADQKEWKERSQSGNDARTSGRGQEPATVCRKTQLEKLHKRPCPTRSTRTMFARTG